jgi:hypothetical protein
MSTTAAEQLKKVQKVSNGIKILFQITIAFGGVGIAVMLLAILLMPSFNLTIGNGDFNADFNPGQSNSRELAGLISVYPSQKNGNMGLINFHSPELKSKTPMLVPATPLLRVGITAIMFVYGSVMLYLANNLAKLFELYAKGEIFTLTVVNQIRKVGIAMLAFPALTLLNSIAGIWLMSQIAPDEHWFELSVSFDHLLAALIVILFSWIMDVGRALREENELTV